MILSDPPLLTFNTIEKRHRIETFTVSCLITQYRALLNVPETVKQMANVVFVLLFIQHPNKQLPVICAHTP